MGTIPAPAEPRPGWGPSKATWASGRLTPRPPETAGLSLRHVRHPRAWHHPWVLIRKHLSWAQEHPGQRWGGPEGESGALSVAQEPDCIQRDQ